MRKIGAFLLASVFLIVGAGPASARVHDSTVANYYFQDDATGSRTRIVVDQGDQILFTVRQAAYPPHSVVIDAYGIDSGYLLIFQTYTTPPLNKPGTFLLYCRAHQDRGHYTTLIVRPVKAQAPSPQPTKSKGSAATAAPKATSGQPTASPTAVSSPTPGAPGPTHASIAPVGVGESTDRRRAPPDSKSLAGVLGRRFGGDVPWTSSLWLAVLAAIPIFAATSYALRVERRRRGDAPGS